MKGRNEQFGAWKERFANINGYVSEHGGWMVSVPGDREMHFLAPPGSPLPDELRELGYIVERIGETQRIAAKKLRARLIWLSGARNLGVTVRFPNFALLSLMVLQEQLRLVPNLLN